MSLGYTLEPGFPFRPDLPALTSDLRNTLLRYDILDYMRRPIRVLFDRARGDSTGPVVWDGDDGDGNPVPNGVYYRRLHLRDEDGSEQLLWGKTFILVEDPAELLRRKHTLTDAGGSYRIPMGLLPVGDVHTFADDTGIPWDGHVSNRVQVHALRTENGNINFTRNEIVIEDRFASRRVDLTLP